MALLVRHRDDDPVSGGFTAAEHRLASRRHAAGFPGVTPSRLGVTPLASRV